MSILLFIPAVWIYAFVVFAWAHRNGGDCDAPLGHGD